MKLLITLAMLIYPSPCSSISTSPSTASVPRLTADRRSRSSSTCGSIGAGSSRTSNIRSRFERATTKLQRTRETNSWRVETFMGVGRGRVEGVNLRLVANSTPLAGRISCRKACIRKRGKVVFNSLFTLLFNLLFHLIINQYLPPKSGKFTLPSPFFHPQACTKSGQHYILTSEFSFDYDDILLVFNEGTWCNQTRPRQPHAEFMEIQVPVIYSQIALRKQEHDH